ncbi:BrnT family toxin [Bilifractor sp. LCP19S3_H10]|uniref:BrnT family toxin n=1 Tax=Bilifractor sp. LCP19S3_H10 TaxID=3438736 RepID=UPI003F917021
MTFEWDQEKNKVNIAKHGISFELASKAFFDPLRIDLYDKRHSQEEDRFITIGYVRGVAILIAYTATEDKVRIISARRALKSEIETFYY